MFDSDEVNALTPSTDKVNKALTPPADNGINHIPDHINQNDIPTKTYQSSQISKPSQTGLQSIEYKRCETSEKDKGQDWATDNGHPQALFGIDWPSTDSEDPIMCLLTKTKASYNIP